MHERIHAPIVKPVLFLHPPDPVGAAKVVNPAASISLRVATQLGVSGRGESFSTPFSSGHTENLHGVPFRSVNCFLCHDF